MEKNIRKIFNGNKGMRRLGYTKSWIQHAILVSVVICSLVFVSGCADVFFGSQKLQGDVSPVTTTPTMAHVTTTIQTPVKACWTQAKFAGGTVGSQLPEAKKIMTVPHADDLEMSGDIIVWDDGRNWDNTLSDIYMFNIATGTEKPLVVVNERQENPEVSGNLVVYSNWTDKKKIYVYDLDTGKDTAIPTNHRAETVDIDGKRVVYDDFITGGTVMYDLSSGKDVIIMADGDLPRISGDNIVYRKILNNRYDLYLNNIPTKKETCISCRLSEQPTADYRIDGNYVVFDTSTVAEPLRLYNIGTGQISEIVPCSGNCEYPTDGIPGAWYDISGDNVVFVSGVDCTDCDIVDSLFVYNIPAKTTKALHLHTESDTELLSYGGGGYPRISGNNVIFWHGDYDLYLIKL